MKTACVYLRSQGSLCLLQKGTMFASLFKTPTSSHLVPRCGILGSPFRKTKTTPGAPGSWTFSSGYTLAKAAAPFFCHDQWELPNVGLGWALLLHFFAATRGPGQVQKACLGTKADEARAKTWVPNPARCLLGAHCLNSSLPPKPRSPPRHCWIPV